MAVKSCSPRCKPGLTGTWSSFSRVGPMRQRNRPLFVGEPSLSCAGVPRSSLLTLSRRLGFSGLGKIFLATASRRQWSGRLELWQRSGRFELREWSGRVKLRRGGGRLEHRQWSRASWRRHKAWGGASREDGGWGGAGTRSQRRPAARFVSRAAARGSIYLDGKRPYRISVQQVLKKAWKRHGYYSSKGFPLGGDSPPMTRQRFAAMRKIAAFDDSSSGGAAGDESSSGGSSSSSSSASSSPSVDFDAALSLEAFSLVAGMAADRLVCSDILCEMKSS